MEPEHNETADIELTTPSLPPEVVELARSGNRLEAIRRYRELVGGSYEQAHAAIRNV
jgi:hypothetical protein